jgi:ABC-type phosphate/phosphonate transport system substrate-binding protein
MMFYYKLLLAVLLGCNVISPAVSADVPVRIAKLAFRPAADVEKRWQPLAEYLNQKVPGFHFRIEAFGYKDLETAIARREVDFVFTNPGHYILMTYRNGLSSPLATLIPTENGRTLSKFGGVIITRAEQTDLNSIRQLQGKIIAAVTKGSLGGYQAQAMELAQSGIRIPGDANLIETGMPHDQVVTAVLQGQADAGFVRTGILEHMAQEGKIDLAKIKLVSARKEEGFPLLLSTRLYPEWPFAAMPSADEDLARQVAAALLSIPHNDEVAKALDIHGFTIPTDYEIVRNMLEVLRLPPFDEAPEFTVLDIWNKYRWQLLVVLSLASLVVLLGVWLLVLNRRLEEGQKRIQRNASELHRLLTALGEGVYGVDRQGICTFVNPSALAMLGFSETELLGNDQHRLFHHHREDGTHYPAAECPISLTVKDGLGRNWQDWF